MMKTYFEQKQFIILKQDLVERIESLEKNIEQIKFLQDQGVPISDITDFTANVR